MITIRNPWSRVLHYSDRTFQRVKGSNFIAMLGNSAYGLVLRFISNIILTRLLAPEDFGVVLVIVSVMQVFQLLTETGIFAYSVRDDEATTPESLRTLHTVQTLRGLMIGGLVFLFAPSIAQLFGKPELTPVFQVVALQPAILGFRGLGSNLKNRARRQRVNEVVGIVTSTLQTAVTLTLAFTLRNSWALILGMMSVAPITVIAHKIVYGFPLLQFGFDRRTLHRLFHFSKFIFLSTALTLVLNQFDRIFIGANLDLTVAGLYGMAISMSEILYTLNRRFYSSILFAELAELRRRAKLTLTEFYRQIRLVRGSLLFIAGGGITYGPTFFEVIFDERYAGAGIFFSILVLRPALSMLSEPHQSLMVVLGKPRSKFYADLMRVAHIAIAAPLAFRFFGVYGLAMAAATMDIVPTFYLHWLTRKEGFHAFREEGLSLAALAAGALTGLAGAIATDAVLSYFFPQGY